MRYVVAALLVLLVGCGTTEDTDEQDQRYQDCLAAGGSYSADEYEDKWSCKVPEPKEYTNDEG